MQLSLGEILLTLEILYLTQVLPTSPPRMLFFILILLQTSEKNPEAYLFCVLKGKSPIWRGTADQNLVLLPFLVSALWNSIRKSVLSIWLRESHVSCIEFSFKERHLKNRGLRSYKLCLPAPTKWSLLYFFSLFEKYHFVDIVKLKFYNSREMKTE